MLEIAPLLKVPLHEFQFSYSRSSGPGGQKVNKTNSKVLLKWNIQKNKSLPRKVKERLLHKLARRISEDGDLNVRSDRFRDRGRNIADCVEKLRVLILGNSFEPRPRKKTKPTRTSREKRLADKRKVSEKKRTRQKV